MVMINRVGMVGRIGGLSAKSSFAAAATSHLLLADGSSMFLLVDGSSKLLIVG